MDECRGGVLAVWMSMLSVGGDFSQPVSSALIYVDAVAEAS
jgi:hypothetical protein